MFKQIALATTLLTATSFANAEFLAASFTYQAELLVSGAPGNGEYDFRFDLLGDPDGEVVIDEPVLIDNAAVINGVLSVELDFGTSPFAGDQLWLQISVRDGLSVGEYTTLFPSQKLTAAPYALHAEMVAIDAIAGAEIADDSITAADLAANAVGAAELASNAVSSDALIDGSVTALDLAVGSVSSVQVADDSLTAADLGADSVGTSEIISGQVQRRISGVCAGGTYLSGVNEDGTVQCAALPVALKRTLERSGRVGEHTSIAIRTDGRPMIVYADEENGGALKLYDCTDSRCSSGAARTLDTVEGWDTDIAIRADGLPLISYYATTAGELRIYVCGDVACSVGTVHTLDSADDPGAFTSIAIRLDGLPIISYYDANNDALRVYECFTTSCSGGVASTLDTEGGVFTSIAIRADGRPLISYKAQSNLKAYDCANTSCTGGTPRTLDSAGDQGKGNQVALGIGLDGLPIISYYDSFADRLKIYRCSDTACSSGNARNISDGGQFSSLAVRDDGRPLISYQTGNVRLGVYDCETSICSRGAARVLDDGGDAGAYTSIAIGADNLPIISHHHEDNHDLKLYSCGDPDCEN